jgi:hypothetical protein
MSPLGFTALGTVEDWDKVMGQIVRHRFNPVDPAAGKETSFGWVQLTDPFETSFAKTNVFFGEHLVGLTFRYDSVQIPAGQFRLHLNKRFRDAKAERKGEELSKREMARMKDDLRAEWVRKVIPTIKLFEMVYHPATNRVWFFGKSKSVVETFLQIFHDTFGLSLQPDSAYTTALQSQGAKVAEKLLELDDVRFSVED